MQSILIRSPVVTSEGLNDAGREGQDKLLLNI